MKTVLDKGERFLVDASGQRVAVLLDLQTYQHLREAAQDNEDVRADRAAKPTIDAQVARGDFTTLEEYRARRSRKK
jgi:hypothetical protein